MISVSILVDTKRVSIAHVLNAEGIRLQHNDSTTQHDV